MLEIKIIGYYEHFNAGDEQYKESFQKIFQKYNLQFIDCDKLHECKFIDSDIIVLGGGDVLNNYFLDKIISVFSGKQNKIIAVSVGLPFQSVLVNTNKLNIIDYVFLRTKQDITLFQQYFHPSRVFYLPDISNFLITDNTVQRPYLTKIQNAKNFGKRIVTISLSRHIYDKNHLSLYNGIIHNLVHFVKYLITFGFHVVFLPFNTNPYNDSENDCLIHNDIVSNISNISNITVINETLSSNELLNVYKISDFAVPMRFHACLFALYNKIPILPIFTTRKIKNLLLDVNWTFGYELDVTHTGIPISIDINILINRFSSLFTYATTSTNLSSKLNYIVKFNTTDTIPLLIDIINSSYSKHNLQLLHTEIKIQELKKIQEIFKNVQDYALSCGYTDFRLVDTDKQKDVIVSIISYFLTNGSLNSNYNWGLKNKIFGNLKYDYYQEWKWILNNEKSKEYTNHLLSNPRGLFNLGYIDQNDYSGSHRSGWQYVYNNIKQFHNESSDLLLDLYVDRTFHWNAEVNNLLGIIPYRKKWMGFVHHTFDTSFSDYNCYKLLQSSDFLKSLKYCKGLIVLSDYLKQWFESEFDKLNIKVPVYYIVHPTDTNVSKFSIKKFKANNDKKLINIGGWLRNTYTFYQLQIPKVTKMQNWFLSDTAFKFRKVALHGKHMNNYYPRHDFLTELHSILLPSNTNCNNTILQNVSCDSKIKNNWNKFLYQDILCKFKSIDNVNYLENNLYDKLLSENVIFIHLVDASAVNTIIECIVRNTPIIINKHPAVIEILGESYPLYYSDESDNYFQISNEVYDLLKDGNKIKQAYKYLKTQNKSRFNITTFVTNFIKLILN